MNARADPHNPDVIWGKVCIRPPVASYSVQVIECILTIRDEPPESLHRTPGPKAILYYLPRSSDLQGERLPRSTRTIWKILRTAGRITQPSSRQRCPQERPEPLVELQLDFKDLIQIDPAATHKQAHAVKVFDAVDVGTSLWLMGEPSASYTAETLFAPLIRLLEQIGLPDRVRFDRGSRFLGSTSMRDFPTPSVRFWYALGVQPIINPAHRPDLNAFVERLHGTIEREYRQVTLPDSLETARQTLPLFQRHYNHERPHQGMTCGNHPPAVAHAQLPLRPRLPDHVDPDRWVDVYHERCFARQVKHNGTILLDDYSYYVGQQYSGSDVVAQIDASTHRIHFLHQQTVVKTRAIKGVVGHSMELAAFVAWCEHEARALWRHYLVSQRLRRVS